MSVDEGIKIGDVIVREDDPSFSRETLTVKDGETLVLGQACKLDTGKVVDSAAADAELVILEAASPVGADGEAVCLVRNAVVNADNLTLSSGTVAQAEAALKDVDATTGYGRLILRSGPTWTTLN